jgi:hypothetical protein
MGWFGFGGSRSRDDRPRADARSVKNAADARDDYRGKRFTYEAVRIDRAGKPSRLPEDLPRRRDREERWDRR